MTQAPHPFSSFGVSDELRDHLDVFEDPGLAADIAPRPLKAFVDADMSMINTFLHEDFDCFLRLDSTHLAMSEDGVLGMVCIDTSEELEMFVPIDRFVSWHAECPKYWPRAWPSEGDAATIRFIFRKELMYLERQLAGPGPLASEIAGNDLADRMAPEPIAGDLGVACEEEIFEICEGMDVPIELTVQVEASSKTYIGYITGTHRAYDGRMGFSFEADEGYQSMPFEAVIAWRLMEEDVEYWDEDLAKSGGRIDLEAIFAEDIAMMAGDYPLIISANRLHPTVSWDDHLEPYRMSRLADDRRDGNWTDGRETRIYLAIAQTLPEGIETVAVRVGGALWAERRGDNASRVEWARRFVGFPISDDMLIQAAASLDALDSARVQSGALFVACGGESATPETLRRLTLLQNNCPIPRSW